MMTNRVKLILSSLVVILSLNLFSITSNAEASTLEPTLVEGNIEGVEALEVEGIIDAQAETVRLVTAYKVSIKTDANTGKQTKNYYDYEYTTYPAGYTYTANESTSVITTWKDMLNNTTRFQYKISYTVSY